MSTLDFDYRLLRSDKDDVGQLGHIRSAQKIIVFELVLIRQPFLPKHFVLAYRRIEQ
jgi:hypothetical protein